MSQVKKIIWPVDPSQNEEAADKNIRNFLGLLKDEIEYEIEPVCVMSADFFTTSEYFAPIDMSALKENIEKDCKDYLKDFAEFNMKPVTILENHFASQGAVVHMFNEYVKEQKPNFVLMSSHGRKGWSRQFLGSFTESFLLQSETPVMVIGPKYKTQAGLKSALMPVELSESSQKFVEDFLDNHSLSFLTSINLYHKISMVDLEDVTWAPTLYGLGSLDTDDVLKKAYETTDQYLKSFMDHPLSEKRLSYEVSKSLEPLADDILKNCAQEKVQMLVMRSEAGGFAARILGSVARTVIRDSSVPVVVYPHKFKK